MAQNQNGIRHNDFKRYSRYCSRRIDRMRKALKLKQGKKTFHKKPVTLQTVTSTKMMMILVFMCQRDWALAQHFKVEMNDEKKNDEDNADNRRIKFALAKKLIKAVKSSKILLQITKQKLDVRSMVEAEAYCGFMTGLYKLEVKKDYKESLKDLIKAKILYQKLGETQDTLEAIMFQERVKQIEPGIRLCSFNIEGMQTSKLISQQIDFTQLEDPDAIKELLHQLQSEKSKKGYKKQTDEFELNGVKIPFKTPKLKHCFFKVENMKAQITEEEESQNQESPHKMTIEERNALYKQFFASIDEAVDIFKKQKTEEAKKSQYSTVIFNQILMYLQNTRAQAQLSKVQYNLSASHFKGEKYCPPQILLSFALNPIKRENLRQKEIIRMYQKINRAIKNLLAQIEHQASSSSGSGKITSASSIDPAVRQQFEFKIDLNEIYIAIHGAMFFGTQNMRKYETALQMLRLRVRKQIDEIVNSYNSYNLSKYQRVKECYDEVMIGIDKTCKQLECLYYGKLLRQRAEINQKQIIQKLGMQNLKHETDRSRSKNSKRKSKSVDEKKNKYQEEKKMPNNKRSKSTAAEQQQNKKKQNFRKDDHDYHSLYDLIQQSDNLRPNKKDNINEWSRPCKIKPTKSQFQLLSGLNFVLKKDLKMTQDYLGMSRQELEYGIDANMKKRIGVKQFRNKAIEYLVKHQTEKLKVTGKAKLIDLQVGLKPIPAKSTINDIASQYVEAPSIAHRIKQEQKRGGITGFVKGLFGK